MDLSAFENLEIRDEKCKEILQSMLDEIQDNDDSFIQILVDLKDDMQVTWEQPWYQKTCRLTRRLDQNENESETFRMGKITKAECDKINKNWAKFVKKFQVPDQPICFARWRNKNTQCKRSEFVPEEFVRRYVTCYLARGLERNLNQVFQHFVECHSAPNKGQYTNLELKVIDICFYHFPRNATQVASKILGRRVRGIRTRLAESLKDIPTEKVKPMKWDLVSATKLLNLLMEYTGLSLEQLKYRQIDKYIWIKIGQQFNKTYESVRRFWYHYLHVQIFVKCHVKIKSLRKRIVKVIKKYPYEVWTDIEWEELVKHFPDGMTKTFLNDAIRSVADNLKNYSTAPLHDVLHFIKQRIKSCPNKRLRTLSLNNDGMLEVINYDA